MNFKKLKKVSGIGSALLLMSGAMMSGTPMMAQSTQSIDATNNDLSASEIFAKAQANYSSLASYSDEGRVVTTLNGVTSVTTFTTRLARANFYLIEWQLQGGSEVAGNTGIQDVWSSGADNLLERGYGLQNEVTPDIALDEAGCFSSGAAATVPMTFFNLQWRDEWSGSESGEVRQRDENVGGVDCFVLKSATLGQTKTLWIGKQDFLIHQVQTEMSAEGMQALAARVTNGNLEIISSLHGLVSTETHTHIILNSPFLRSDFVPTRAFYVSSSGEDN
jgi:hypothetical protein